MKKTKIQKGITLIALIITIVVLLILAAVAISSITNDGILSYAQNAAKDYNQAVKNEQSMLDEYLEFLEGSAKIVDENGNDLRNKTVTSNTEVYDKYGNKIVVPAGFKIRVDSTTNNADTVTEGIVIEDESGNQFVWIPVGKIYTDTAKTEANAKTIILGRYSWSGSTGTLIQPTADKPYTSNVPLISGSNNFTEYQPTSVTSNSKARNINHFYDSAIGNGGYYLGRYEAGDSSYTTVAERTGTTGTSTPGTLVCKANQVPYNWVTQPDAASKCRDMYVDGYSKGTFSSDLLNSYAWDTAIVFIQTFDTETYANTIGVSATSINAPQTTGTNILNATSAIDEQLNIFDMAGNCREWTTETYSSDAEPCVNIGGHYYTSSGVTRSRYIASTIYSSIYHSFRPILYVAL